MHTQQHAANAQIALTMDADISGGLFVKGFVLNAAQFKDCECSHALLASAVSCVRRPCDSSGT